MDDFFFSFAERDNLLNLVMTIKLHKICVHEKKKSIEMKSSF